MEITGLSTRVVNAEMRSWVFVRIETDEPGLHGWGEATLEWTTRAVVGALEDLAPLMLGRDPRDKVGVHTYLGLGDTRAVHETTDAEPHDPGGDGRRRSLVFRRRAGPHPHGGRVLAGAEAPGLGIEVDEAVRGRHPFAQDVPHTRNAALGDGTVVDG